MKSYYLEVVTEDGEGFHASEHATADEAFARRGQVVAEWVAKGWGQDPRAESIGPKAIRTCISERLTADQSLMAALQRAGIRPHGTSYRGMFDRERCIGVRCKSRVDLVIALVKACDTIEQAQDVVKLLRCADEDSLGMGKIVYWPAIVWTDHLERLADSIKEKEEAQP